MNFIFISPQFPHTYWQFCDRLRQNEVNVLGIGDAPYWGFDVAHDWDWWQKQLPYFLNHLADEKYL